MQKPSRFRFLLGMCVFLRWRCILQAADLGRTGRTGKIIRFYAFTTFVVSRYVLGNGRCIVSRSEKAQQSAGSPFSGSYPEVIAEKWGFIFMSLILSDSPRWPGFPLHIVKNIKHGFLAFREINTKGRVKVIASLKSLIINSETVRIKIRSTGSLSE
jgi:hypothetical protein